MPAILLRGFPPPRGFGWKGDKPFRMFLFFPMQIRRYGPRVEIKLLGIGLPGFSHFINDGIVLHG